MFAKEMLKQSLPLLILCGIGAIIAGSILNLMNSSNPDNNIFLKIPGLLIVIPAIIAMRGNISTALGSRLGSAYHLGVIKADDIFNNELKQNIVGSLLLSLIMSFIIGILAYIISFLMGLSDLPHPIIIIFIVVIAGVLSGLILSFLTIGIIYLVFKQGYDPDNITGPALATFGDIITILCIFGSAILAGGLLWFIHGKKS
mgnify:CR=1 FL=1